MRDEKRTKKRERCHHREKKKRIKKKEAVLDSVLGDGAGLVRAENRHLSSIRGGIKAGDKNTSFGEEVASE